MVIVNSQKWLFQLLFWVKNFNKFFGEENIEIDYRIYLYVFNEIYIFMFKLVVQ